MPIHKSSKGYETGVNAYTGGRPGYPSEALDWLRDVVGVGRGRNTMELGAGTGKFMPLLQDCGGTIIAVEPVEAMRQQLVHDFPEIDAIAGSAEAIPLPDGSVDAVVCAQAFTGSQALPLLWRFGESFRRVGF